MYGRVVCLLLLLNSMGVAGFTQCLPHPRRLSQSSSRVELSCISEPITGRWVYNHMNPSSAVLPPPPGVPPRALIHFIGGAFVGASPSVLYRPLLNRLSDEGYIVVTTQYSLTFDHLSTCDNIIQSFESVAPSLARQYGPLPVIGVGHSLGALLQVIITTLFPQTPRAGNVLVSFNERDVR